MSGPFVQPSMGPQLSAAQRALKYVPCIEGDMFDVKVGPTNQIFHVHKKVLDASPFLRKAMKKEWTEEVITIRPAKDYIDLTPHPPYTVRTYIQWLYSHNFPDEATATDLVDLYVFGDEMMHNEFMNAILDTLMNSDHTTLFTIKLIHTIYERTKEDSPMRRLAIDSFAWFGSIEDDTIDAVQDEVMKDLLRASMKKGRTHKYPPWLLSREQYHHESESITERTKDTSV